MQKSLFIFGVKIHPEWCDHTAPALCPSVNSTPGLEWPLVIVSHLAAHVCNVHRWNVRIQSLEIYSRIKFHKVSPNCISHKNKHFFFKAAWGLSPWATKKLTVLLPACCISKLWHVHHQRNVVFFLKARINDEISKNGVFKQLPNVER